MGCRSRSAALARLLGCSQTAGRIARSAGQLGVRRSGMLADDPWVRAVYAYAVR